MSNLQEQQYLDIVSELKHEVLNGGLEPVRDDHYRARLFGRQMRFDLSKGFPLLTHKRVFLRGIFEELMWFLRGQTDNTILQNMNVHIWDQWKRRYSLDREIVFIEPMVFDRVEYDGVFTLTNIVENYGFSCDSNEYKLLKIWESMIGRCYDESRHNYKYYGAIGVSVCKEWHDPLVFISDVKDLPHWSYKLDNWNDFELDKDYYGSNLYSKKTCVWLRSDENKIYAQIKNPISVKNPSGTIETFLTIASASKGVGISKSSLHRILHNGFPEIVKGNNKNYVGYEFDFIDLDGKLPRLDLIKDGDLGSIYGKQWRSFGDNSVDQIQWVIDEIKTNPASSRLIVSAWNPDDVINGDLALPPCHTMFQFFVKNGKLSCQLYQRSADFLIGVPFNIASYALLTHIIAEECGLEVGEFVWVGGDIHVYGNQVEFLEEIESAQTYQFPTLKFKERTRKREFDQYQWHDIEIENYQCGSTVVIPVST